MITLEDLKQDQFELVAQWLSRPEINRWLSGEWRNRSISAVTMAIAVRNQRNRFWLVRKDGEGCGLVAFADLDAADHTAMIWYVLGESRLSGQGIMSEAIRQLVRIGFAELGLASIYAWTMADNLASQKALRHASFREAGRLRRTAFLDDRQVDRLYFDLLPSDT